MEGTEIDFSNATIEFRSEASSHQFHDWEGITPELIIKTLRNAKVMHPDPRKLKKRIQLWHVTETIQDNPLIRLTIIFQIKKNNVIHVINAYLGTFFVKNLYEKAGLKPEMGKEVEKEI